MTKEVPCDIGRKVACADVPSQRLPVTPKPAWIQSYKPSSASARLRSSVCISNFSNVETSHYLSEKSTPKFSTLYPAGRNIQDLLVLYDKSKS